MLYLSDSIRYDDLSLQRLLNVPEDTHTRIALLLALWALARGLALHIVAHGVHHAPRLRVDTKEDLP